MKHVGLFLYLILLFSCEGIVRFEEPQPEGVKAEVSVPKKLTGTYQLFDSPKSELIITRERVIQKITVDTTFRFSSLDSADRIQILEDAARDSLKNDPTFFTKIVGDTVYGHFGFVDTLLSIPDGDVLKKFKGYYLLNSCRGENSWYVTKLGVVKAGLVLGNISTGQDLKSLQALTNAPSDTIYTFRPTRRQFKKFINEHGDRLQTLYVKVPARQKH
ncbi:hypothetical protein [Chryseolinea lacunae]|uniref:Lipoprotein n=1 Tax=Chryseolinea lacunae TaxID=2801331 RepID=A0ABS1KMC8_9BACT|nr:hypothetical protein [Chryseolinea lacunae]MBL0740402.1 hypothetical protein [Chryseolinea lacunae]